MKSKELQAIIEGHSESMIDSAGNVTFKIKMDGRYKWMTYPACNIVEMAERIEQLEKIADFSLLEDFPR